MVKLIRTTAQKNEAGTNEDLMFYDLDIIVND